MKGLFVDPPEDNITFFCLFHGLTNALVPDPFRVVIAEIYGQLGKDIFAINVVALLDGHLLHIEIRTL